jgi:hypothetical protein
MVSRDGHVHCFVNGRKAFSCTRGVRVITDHEGTVMEVTGIGKEPIRTEIVADGRTSTVTVAPNEVIRFTGD